MATITDTSILHWLPFDSRGELWKLAFINAENQNWNSTDPKNGTSIHEAMMMASKQGETTFAMASPAQLGLATGLLLSLLLNSRIWTAKANKEGFGCKLLFGNHKPYQWILHLTPSSSFTFASSKTFILPYLYLLPLLALILLLPVLSILAVFLLPFAIYRLCVFAYLKHERSSSSNGRLEEKKLFPGADAVWAFNESFESYSVINALILLEGTPNISSLRRILSDRLGAFPKLRMRRGFTLGYATWQLDPHLDLGNLVRWLPGTWGNSAEEEGECRTSTGLGDPSGGCGALHSRRSHESEIFMEGLENISRERWNRNNLSRIVENLCNVPLPGNHTTSWEARVGRAMPWEDVDSDEESTMESQDDCETSCETNTTVFPILFRIHHSVGDGASLLQLLMSTLIDNEMNATNGNESDRQSTTNSQPSSLSRPLKFQSSPKQEHRNNETNPIHENKPETDKPKTDSADLKKDEQSDESKNEARSERSRRWNNPPDRPASRSANDVPFREKRNADEKESSFLYGRRLSGKKMIYWDSDSVTVEEVKKIRAATRVKFTEILLSGISAALAAYWEARNNGDFNARSNGTKTSPRNNRIQKKTLETEKNPPVEDNEDSDALEDVPEENEEEGGPTERFGNTTTTALKNEERNPPPSVKLVLPAILGSLFQKPKLSAINGCNELENLFSVAVMTLPVGKTGMYPLERLSKISDATGYMMPLRKDSVRDCKARKSTDDFERKASMVQTRHSPSTTDDKTASATSEQRKKDLRGQPEAMSPHSRGEDAVDVKKGTRKPAVASPEVLTYYYTAKEAETSPKSDPQISFSSRKSSSVQYRKDDNSAEVVISDKEPYACPTTIFFTNNKHSDTRSRKEEVSTNKGGAAHVLARETNTGKQKTCDAEIFRENTDGIPTVKSETENDSLNKFTGERADNSIEPHFDKTAIKDERNPQSISPSSRSSITLPSSPTIQHLLTRWLALDIVATVLPSLLAAPMMSVASKGVALVMSNLPGPPKRVDSVLGGHPMKEIVFWAPHRGYTGLGITVISYDGRLHIGLMADEAVVPTRRGARFIMSAILDELHSLEAAVSTTC